MNILHRRGSIPYGQLSRTDSATLPTTIEGKKSTGRDIAGFQALGLYEYLDTDDRPIFALDLRSQTNKLPVYQNAALKKLQVLGTGTGNQGTEHVVLDAQSGFLLDWAVSFPEATNLPPSTHWGIRWTARTLRNKWRIITGNVTTLPPDTSHRHSLADTGSTCGSRSPSKSKMGSAQLDRGVVSPGSLEKRLAAYSLDQAGRDAGPQVVRLGEGLHENPNGSQLRKTADNSGAISPFDITRPKTTHELSDHLQFFQQFDWASTELGPMSTWSLELRRLCNLVMADPRPCSLFLGEQKTIMYNESYSFITGQKHPGMMGKNFVDAWGEIADDFIVPFEQAATTGTGYLIIDARFNINRHDYLEETYYALSVIPVPLGEGELAFYNPVIETTRQVLSDRRTSFLLHLGQCISSATEPKHFWSQLVRGLENDHLDLPFAVLYSAGWGVKETSSESTDQSHVQKDWSLEGLVRVPERNTVVPRRFDSDKDIEDFLPTFLDLIKADLPTLLPLAGDSFPTSLADNLRTEDGVVPFEAAVFLSVKSTSDIALGFLILGVNPMKRYDDDYRIFVELLSRQLTSSIAAAALFEEETSRNKLAAEQATLDRNLLSKKLAVQTHVAAEVETRFRTMADLAPTGMFHIDPEGILVYANNEYYKLTEHPRNVSYPMSWYNVLMEEDHTLMDTEWAKLMAGEEVNFEIRLKRPFITEELFAGEKITGPTWIIAAAYAEKSLEGEVTGILGCITDISRVKWAEGFQNAKMLEAVELKRQQENFIDMTSHEMRNPLSAIIQSADWIGNLSEFDGGSKDVIVPREVVDSIADASETILLCAQHQKRIIDDILTLSKLDADLLYITPIEVQPALVVQNALKMFDAELQKADLTLRFVVDESYKKLSVDWVKLDPSRVLQIFINLITNAIKFTQTEEKRQIIVKVGASLKQPEGKDGLQYLPRCYNTSKEVLSNGKSDDFVYLTVAVQDSGRGLDKNEKNQLFKRFSQASVRTHVQYGGNGLGLFISRRLTEIQGGQIGVASEAGVGSTFAFYIRTPRCSPPEGYKSPKLTAVDVEAHAKMITPTALARIQKSPGLPKVHEGKILEIPSTPRHVLVVEDNLVNQKVLSKQLRAAGCIVSVANHGGEALEFLQTTNFWAGKEETGVQLSIVLMDLEMPVMDGITCVQKIRELQRDGMISSHVPVIAVTANARSEQIANAKEHGMDSVVTKPFRIPELIPEIDRQLRRHSMEGERPVVEDSLGRSASAPA